MRRGFIFDRILFVAGMAYAFGILSAILLPNILIVVLLTALFLLLCIASIR